jgi:predicted nucleic acid-binding protein
VTRYLLDTNIISDALKPQPSLSLSAWIENQKIEELFIASFSLAEIWRGVLTTPTGRRRRDLEAWFAGPDGPPTLFADRVLAFDEHAALEWGRIIAEGRLIGRRAAQST